jgi:hypothetical protein
MYQEKQNKGFLWFLYFFFKKQRTGTSDSNLNYLKYSEEYNNHFHKNKDKSNVPKIEITICAADTNLFILSIIFGIRIISNI